MSAAVESTVLPRDMRRRRVSAMRRLLRTGDALSDRAGQSDVGSNGHRSLPSRPQSGSTSENDVHIRVKDRPRDIDPAVMGPDAHHRG